MASVQTSLNFSAQPCHGHKVSKRLVLGIKCGKTGKYLYDRKKLKILIAGGGIAGLVFALAAKRGGFDVKVFEKDLSAVRGEGNGRGPIQLLSSALAVLESIDKDVSRQIREASFVTGDKNNGLADGLTGEWFVKFDLLTPALLKGIPVTQMICRMDLQRLLLNAVGTDVVINNAKVMDFVSDANKVTVFLESGEQYEGDVLVGSDGIRSMVRSKLFGHREPNYSNFACYTGLADPHPQDMHHIGYKIYLGTNQYFVASNVGKGRMQWYAFIREAPKSCVSTTGNNKNMVVERFGEWSNEVLAMMDTTPEHMIIRRPVYDTDMVSSWGRGRAILVGDAAHAMLPNLGQGGSMAIEDCFWLMVELQNVVERNPLWKITSDELALAFKRFEKKRQLRVRTVHSICRIASVMTSFYQTYLENLSTGVKVKHPVILISKILLQFALPKFMDWPRLTERSTSNYYLIIVASSLLILILILILIL